MKKVPARFQHVLRALLLELLTLVPPINAPAGDGEPGQPVLRRLVGRSRTRTTSTLDGLPLNVSNGERETWGGARGTCPRSSLGWAWAAGNLDGWILLPNQETKIDLLVKSASIIDIV